MHVTCVTYRKVTAWCIKAREIPSQGYILTFALKATLQALTFLLLTRFTRLDVVHINAGCVKARVCFQQHVCVSIVDVSESRLIINESDKPFDGFCYDSFDF